MKALLIGLACCCFNPDRRHDAGYNHLSHTTSSELVFEIGGCESTPAPLGDHDVLGRLVKFRQQIGPPFGKGGIAA